MVGDTTSASRNTGFPPGIASFGVVTFRSGPAAGFALGTSPGQILICVNPAAGCQVFSWPAPAMLTMLAAAQKTASALDILATHFKTCLSGANRPVELYSPVYRSRAPYYRLDSYWDMRCRSLVTRHLSSLERRRYVNSLGSRLPPSVAVERRMQGIIHAPSNSTISA